MIKAAIFDMGGTLIDYPLPTKIAALCQSEEIERISGLPKSVLLEISNEFTRRRKEIQTTLKEFPLPDLFKEIFRKYKIDVNEADSLVKLIHSRYTANLRVYPDTKDALRSLRRHGYLIGLISNVFFPGKWHFEDLERFRLQQFFRTIVWSSEFGWRKPHPLIFQRGLKDLGIRAEEAIYVGDKLKVDVLGAQQVGMKGVLIYRSMDQKDISLLLDTHPYRVITDLNKLVDIARRA